MLALLLVGAAVFGLLAAFINEEPVHKVFIIACVLCVVVFLILILLHAAGTPIPLRWPD